MPDLLQFSPFFLGVEHQRNGSTRGFGCGSKHGIPNGHTAICLFFSWKNSYRRGPNPWLPRGQDEIAERDWHRVVGSDRRLWFSLFFGRGAAYVSPSLAIFEGGQLGCFLLRIAPEILKNWFLPTKGDRPFGGGLGATNTLWHYWG